jgi:MFS superfamily sulfate permease-like transporter
MARGNPSVSAIGREIAAGLTLAAIVIPSQMANARLGGFAPEVGLVVFVAATAAFLIFGHNRLLSVGADSSIAPIFAGVLGALDVAAGERAQAAALLALMVGVMVTAAGAFRLGRIADLLSKPVFTGFLTGVAIHILLSQTPAMLGVAKPSGPLWEQVAQLWASVPSANALALAVALSTFGVAFLIERISPRMPGALAALGVATLLSSAFGLQQKGLSTLGALHGSFPLPHLPMSSFAIAQDLFGLSFMLALIVMVQSGATTRAFSRTEADIDRDFIGVGAANCAAGLFGAFPVNASPPSTSVALEAGGHSPWTALVAAGSVLTLLLLGTELLADTPTSALAGILLLIAVRLIHVSTFREMLRHAPEELALALITVGLIVFLPIQTGVAAAIFLSLGHGLFIIARARLVIFEHVAGTTIWWPEQQLRLAEAEQVPGVLVVGFQAPLTFLNVYDFRRQLRQLIAAQPSAPRLLVLEASGMIQIDFTAAELLKDMAARLRDQGTALAVARLEAVRAQTDFERFGVTRSIGDERFFRSVAEAVSALDPG